MIGAEKSNGHIHFDAIVNSFKANQRVFYPHAVVATAFLMHGLDESLVKNVLKAIVNNRSFKEDREKQRIAYDTLKMIHDNEELTTQEKEEILKALMPPAGLTGKETVSYLLRQMGCVQGILLSKQTTVFKEALHSSAPLDLENEFSTAFYHALEMPKDLKLGNGFKAAFDLTIGKFRSPFDLLVYLGVIKTLPPGQQIKMQEAFQQFVVSVLENKFIEKRNNDWAGENYKSFLSKHPGLKERWEQGDAYDLLAVDEGKPSQAAFDYFDYFNKRIIGFKHLNIEEYPILLEYLTNHRIPEKSLNGDPHIGFQLNCINLCQGAPNEKHLLENIKKYLERQTPKPEFLNDVNGRLGQLSGGIRRAKLGYVAINGDNPCDLFRMGTEVAGSCQRVDGDPELNKGLLSYVMNPANRIFAIKDKATGVIIARCLARLMKDDSGNPALFIEESYPAGTHFNEELMSLAKRQAERLNLPLYKVGEGIKLTSFVGALNLNEYADSAGGIQREAFTINAIQVS
jgi:hypothetical protein